MFLQSFRSKFFAVILGSLENLIYICNALVINIIQIIIFLVMEHVVKQSFMSISFRDDHLVIYDFEPGRNLHVKRGSDDNFDCYLTSNDPLRSFFEIPQRLVWTPDFKSVPVLMQLFAFLDDLPFE